MKLEARWTDDCQGKKDYDGRILSISSRYWPPRGGYSIINRGPDGTTIEDGPGPGYHSATSSLCIWDEESEDGCHLDLATADYKGQTLEEVQGKVEAWAQEQMNKAVGALRVAFKT